MSVTPSYAAIQKMHKPYAAVRAMSAGERQAHIRRLEEARTSAHINGHQRRESLILDALHVVERVEHDEQHYARLEAETAGLTADGCALRNPPPFLQKDPDP